MTNQLQRNGHHILMEIERLHNNVLQSQELALKKLESRQDRMMPAPLRSCVLTSNKPREVLNEVIGLIHGQFKGGYTRYMA
jgi:hypothetical protein